MAVNINVPSQVKTYADLAAFPASGALKTIYIAEDTNKTYRWTGSVYVEVSAAGASGITIGTTAITSGTVGRVLFEGTGNVVQESANLAWDNANQLLQVTRLLGATIRVNAQSSSTSKFQFTQELSVGVPTEIGFISNQFGTGLIVQSYNSIYFNPGNTERMRIVSGTGNVLINTTTDAGYRLDVNGTARVSGNLNLGTGGYIYGETTTPFLRLSNIDGSFFGYSNTQITAVASYLRFNVSGAELMRLIGTSVLIGTTTNAGYKLDVNGTARVSGDMTIATASGATLTLQSNNSNIVWTSGAFGIYFNTTRLVRFGNDGTIRFAQNIIVAGTTNSVIDSSAILQANSTTRGFLPPRMTTTEKNAIASPATGLMVYDNVLNRPCFYDGTTWITL